MPLTCRVLENQLNLRNNSIKSYLVPIQKLNTEFQKRISTSFNLLFIGVIRYDKGLDILIEALNRCNDIPYTLQVSGTPEVLGIDEVEKIIKKSRKKDRIITNYEYLDDDTFNDYFLNATYTILPYRKSFKAQSVVFTDSVKRFTPLICSKESQNGYDTENFSLGEVFNSEDINSLENSIREAYKKWINKDLPKKQNYLNYLRFSSPTNIAKSIINSF